MEAIALLLCLTFVTGTVWDQNVCPLSILGLGPKLYQFWEFRPPTESEIKIAYRKQSLSHHPDKNKSPNAAERFHLIHQSYVYLRGVGIEAQSRRLHASEKYQHYGLVLRRISNILSDLTWFFMSTYNAALQSLHNLWRNPVSFTQACWHSLRSITSKTVIIYTVVAWVILQFLDSIYVLVCRIFHRLTRQRALTVEELDRRRHTAYELKQQQLKKGN